MGFYESHKGMFTSDKLDWETPQWLSDKLDAKCHFDVDVFTNGRNSKCGRFFTPEDDALSKSCGAYVVRKPSVRPRHGGVHTQVRGGVLALEGSSARPGPHGHRMVLEARGPVREGGVHTREAEV